MTATGLYLYGSKGFADTIALLSFVSLYSFGISQSYFFSSNIKHEFNPYHYHLLGVSHTQRFFVEFRKILVTYELVPVLVLTALLVLYFETWSASWMQKICLLLLYIIHVLSSIFLAVLAKNWFSSYLDGRRKEGSEVTMAFILLHLAFSQILFGLTEPKTLIDHLAFFNPVGALFYLPVNPMYNLSWEASIAVILICVLLLFWYKKLKQRHVLA
jgi:hypothetical protein